MEAHAAVIGKLEAIKILEKQNSESPNMKIVIVFDWKREILFFKEVYHHEEDNSLEMEAFDTSRPKGEMLQEIVLSLQKFAVSHRSLSIYAYDQSNFRRPIFATERCTALREKVVQFHGIRMSDVYEVNACYKGCQMEMCFFVHGSCKNNLFFTAGFSNPTATDELVVKLLDAANRFSALDSIGFAVSLSDDDYFKIKEYVNKVADVLTKRLQQAKRDYNSCADVRREDQSRLNVPRKDVEPTREEYARMSEDAFKRFFLTPDEKAKEEKEAADAAEAAERSSNLFRYSLRSSRLQKPNLIDLTSAEDVSVVADPTDCQDDVYFDLNVSEIGEDKVSFDNFYDKKTTTCRLGWDTIADCAVNSEKAESEEFKKWFRELNDTVPDGHEDLAPPSKLKIGMEAILENMMSEDPRYAELFESVRDIMEAMERECKEIENPRQQKSPELAMIAGLSISEPQSEHHRGAANYHHNKSTRDHVNARYSENAPNGTMPVLGRGSDGNMIHLTAEKKIPKSKLFEKDEVVHYVDRKKKSQASCSANFNIPETEQSSEHSSRASSSLNAKPSSDIKGRPPIRSDGSIYTKPRSRDPEQAKIVLEMMLPKFLQNTSKIHDMATSQQVSASNEVIELKDDSEDEAGDENVADVTGTLRRKALYKVEEEPKLPNKIFKTKKRNKRD